MRYVIVGVSQHFSVPHQRSFQDVLKEEKNDGLADCNSELVQSTSNITLIMIKYNGISRLPERKNNVIVLRAKDKREGKYMRG